MSRRSPVASCTTNSFAAEVATEGIDEITRRDDELGAVRRPRWRESKVGDAAHGFAGRAHDEDAAAVALGSKRDAAAVGRKSRLRIGHGGIGSEVDRIPSADAQQEDVFVAADQAGVDDRLSIRRQARPPFLDPGNPSAARNARRRRPRRRWPAEARAQPPGGGRGRERERNDADAHHAAPPRRGCWQCPRRARRFVRVLQMEGEIARGLKPLFAAVSRDTG